MLPLTTWLIHHGSTMAVVLDSRREFICGMVSVHLAKTFPLLCYDAKRIDAVSFQQHTFHETPRRFHRTLQSSLYFASLTMIEREYQWSWTVLKRYGVTREPMLAMVRWYFEAARGFAVLNDDEHVHLSRLETTIFQMIHDVTEEHAPARVGVGVLDQRTFLAEQ